MDKKTGKTMGSRFAARARSAKQHVNAAGAARERHNYSAAMQHFREGLALSRRLMIAEPADDQHVYLASRCERGIGDVLEIQGDLEGALAHLRAGNELLETRPCPDLEPLPEPTPAEAAPLCAADGPATVRPFAQSESDAEVARDMTASAEGFETKDDQRALPSSLSGPLPPPPKRPS